MTDTQIINELIAIDNGVADRSIFRDNHPEKVMRRAAELFRMLEDRGLAHTTLAYFGA